MSSFLDPTLAPPLVDNPNTSMDHMNDFSFVRETQPVPPSPLSLEERLRSLTPRTPVTWVLVAANVVLFTAMALTHGRLFHFSQDTLLTWGGGLAPRVFDHQWWRAGSHMFLHDNLAHLASNLLFLLLIAPLVERLLGSTRFALVYLLAGLGGGLLVMGTYPQQVVVGASAAVYGVYGALLGCCLRGPRSIPWRAVAQRGGLLLLYIAVSLLGQWLDFARQPVAHLGGFVFGLVGGLLCGHQLQPRSVRWRLSRLAVIASVCVVLISLTARGVHRCAAKALAYYGRYATAKDRERELLGRFEDALRQWEHGKITSAEWKRVLEKTLIPAWEDIRSSCGLKLTGELAELEQRSFTMQDFWSDVRSLRGEPTSHDDKPLTVEEYGKAYRLLCKVRLDTWRALAKDLPGNRVLIVRALMDDHELNALFAALDDEVNEDNPLYRWFELRRGLRVKVQNLLVNGSFEEGPEPRVQLENGSIAIKGWVVSQGNIDYLDSSYWEAADGKRSLDLNGITAGAIRQTFKTRKGEKYRVRFALAGNPGGGPREKKLQVSAGGKTTEYTFDVTGKTRTDMGWVSKTWEFTATADETTLEFRSLTEGDAGPALDDVVVVAISE